MSESESESDCVSTQQLLYYGHVTLCLCVCGFVLSLEFVFLLACVT